MKIYYLENSGFAVEMEQALLVFDCCRFDPQGGTLCDGVVNERDLAKYARVYFFVSHRHADHYNRAIYALQNANPNTTYIIALGTPQRCAPEKCVVLKKGDDFADDYLKVHACGSTDLGVSFLVWAEDKTLFHAGDLNCWHWMLDWSEAEEMAARSDFTQELAQMRSHVQQIDVAFFPVDPRMKGTYDDGAREFAAAFSPKLFVPMHCQDDFSVTEKFQRDMQTDTMKVFSYSHRGASMAY